MKPVKPKICKAPGCEIKFTPSFSTTQKVCSPTCAIELDKAKKKVKREKETRTAVKKMNEESRSWQKKQTQAAFNKFIRLRDHDQPCISCGVLRAKWDAGHYLSVGAAPHLRFEEDNCFKQCFSCNQPRGGNPVRMRQGMVERIGDERVLAIETDTTPRQHKIVDLVAIRAHYKQKIKELQAELTGQNMATAAHE